MVDDIAVGEKTPRLLVPALVTVAAMMSIIGSLGAPLVNTVALDNHVPLSTAQWMLTGALLTGALATPVMGRLGDGPHKRRILIVALTIVLAGSIMAALSRDFTVLVLGRGLQGVGLGLLPVTMAIARQHLDHRASSRTIASLSVTAAIGVGLGYPITSGIADIWNYHAAFWFGALMMLFALVAVVFFIPRDSPGQQAPFDVVGAVLLDGAVIGLSVVLAEGGTWGWSSARSLVFFIVSVVLLVGWVFYELRQEHPLVTLRQLRLRPVMTADVSAFLISWAMYLFIPVVVEFVQVPTSLGYGFGGSIVISGILLVPLSVGTFAASRTLGWFQRTFGTRLMIPLGATIFAVASGFFAVAHQHLWQAFVSVGLAGIGAGFTYAAMPGFIVRAVPLSDTGSATGFYQVVRSVGLSVGSAVATSILARYTVKGDTFPSEGGFVAALYTACALCLVVAIASYVLPGHVAPEPVSDGVSRDIQGLMEENAELGASSLMLAEEPVEDDSPS